MHQLRYAFYPSVVFFGIRFESLMHDDDKMLMLSAGILSSPVAILSLIGYIAPPAL